MKNRIKCETITWRRIVILSILAFILIIGGGIICAKSHLWIGMVSIIIGLVCGLSLLPGPAKNQPVKE